MKIYIALCAILAVCTARVVINAYDPSDLHLLGAEECTWGPSYWCENIKTAAGCNATKHCIKTTWKDMEVPEDNDSVCTICKDMVQQARDQLESNQTQEDLKAVFEGSCKLIHIKPIVHECITIVDQYIPDLVETLASQMNPSVVCSVSGLCNSAHIDQLLSEHEQSKSKIDKVKARSLEKDELEPDECSKCYTVATHMEQKIHQTPRDKMLKHMFHLCGELSTFSDACSATVLTYFNTIYNHLQENFNAPNICHLSGQCSDKFHKHEDINKTLNVEIRPLSSVGMVDVSDDLPCKLCEQLVGHLRDLLVANTTEAEFQVVLEGLCKQTKSFSSECTAIVDEYYPQIYEYLTKELDSNFICQMSGICPGPDKSVEDAPIWPLVPKSAAKIGVRIFQSENKDLETDKQSAELSKSEVESMQLPIERLIPFPLSEVSLDVTGTEKCTLCEYILHYIQDKMTNPVTEDKVKDTLKKVCKRLPESIKDQCTEFVDTYGDAVVAILVQEIDPSQVCPMLRLCPSEKLIKFWNNIPKKFTLEEEVQNKPNCPLCLLAVSQIYNVIKNNKTEANIQTELNKLCSHLPNSLSQECESFVQGYSKELIELLLADLTPQEICVYFKLCDPSKNHDPSSEFVTDKDGEIMTNEIPDTSVAPVADKSTFCVVCEFAMHYVDKALGNEKEKSKVEKAVHTVCNHLPKTISRECNQFVVKYGDAVIDIITKDVSPKQVCTMMGLCSVFEKRVKAYVTECAVCKSIISVIDELMDDSKYDNNIEQAVSKACKYVPANKQHKCVSLMDIYERSIVNLLTRNETMHTVCNKIALCAPNDFTAAVSLETSRIKRSYEKNRIKHCTWGPVYWCSTNETARECKAVEHCKENVWKADFAPPKQITLSEAEPNI
nr:PREDICTED: prosaposin [Megachile rotundata]XP_012144582.1 PREDICTED: prosaposin [Megachile rotundata]XP_012144583.1 PREDICTED: prosaposin [Megachile rotundata]